MNPAKAAPALTVADAAQALHDAETRLSELEHRVVHNDHQAVSGLRPARAAVDDARLHLEQAERVADLVVAQANRDAGNQVIAWLNGPELHQLAVDYETAYQHAVTAQVRAGEAWHRLYTEYAAHLRQARHHANAGPVDYELLDSGFNDFTVVTDRGTWRLSDLKFADLPDDVALAEARDVLRGRPPRLSMVPRLARWLTRGRGNPAPQDAA